MELEGLHCVLKKKRLQVGTLVTDRHGQILSGWENNIRKSSTILRFIMLQKVNACTHVTIQL